MKPPNKIYNMKTIVRGYKKRVSTNIIKSNAMDFLKNKQKFIRYLIQQHQNKFSNLKKKEKKIIKGCTKKTFANIIIKKGYDLIKN